MIDLQTDEYIIAVQHSRTQLLIFTAVLIWLVLVRQVCAAYSQYYKRLYVGNMFSITTRICQICANVNDSHSYATSLFTSTPHGSRWTHPPRDGPDLELKLNLTQLNLTRNHGRRCQAVDIGCAYLTIL